MLDEIGSRKYCSEERREHSAVDDTEFERMILRNVCMKCFTFYGEALWCGDI